jgi:hypothetical protein
LAKETLMRSNRRDHSLGLAGCGAFVLAFLFIMVVGYCAVRAEEGGEESGGPEILVIPPYFHHHQARCQRAETLQITFVDSDKKISKPRPVAPDKAPVALKVYNQLPPPLPNQFDQAWLADIEGGGGYLLVGTDGYVCGRVGIPDEDWKPLLAEIDGDPA